MKKTVTLDSKIKKYASLACGVTAVTGASAQVVYNDINPDVTLTPGGTSQYTIDFDGGGTFDVAFAMFQGSQTGTYPYAGYNIPYTISYVGGVATFGSAGASANGWMGSSSGPVALSAGNTIGSSGTFYSSQGAMAIVQGTTLGAPINGTYGPYTDGNFAGQDAFLGVRFDISGSVHYGWVRVEAAADGTSMILKEYAYDMTAGTAISAGDTGSGTSSVEDIDGQVTINNVYNKLNIKLDGFNEADVTVIGLDGKQYANQVIGSVAVLDLSDLSTGIYLVNVSTNEGTTTKKIYVK